MKNKAPYKENILDVQDYDEDRKIYEEDQISNPADADDDYEEGYKLLMSNKDDFYENGYEGF